ncbi:hypothetical protein LTR85_009122 [Meristemomyces frigidus]|nr:hypothetical protein LTR85_009122 [Meristemomyces frigidus]
MTLSLLAISATAQDDTATCDYDDPDWSNPCVSYGVDFQDQGSYFQNISSTDPFTFVSFFEGMTLDAVGCQADTCDNILVDPNGDEYLCSDTNLTPDDTNQMSTCPMDKDQLWSGDWSVILISNNGDACPIAYERDFSLTVAEPVTTTYTPTVTLSATITPITNVTSITTTTDSITVTSTVTSAKTTVKPTTTVTPHQVTSTKTVTMGTVRKTKYTAVPTLVTKTVVQTCSIPPTQRWPDPFCTITPTLVSAAALSTASAEATSAGRRRDNMRRVPADRAARIAERKARLAAARKEKRGLDVATTTLTDLNTSDYVTTTSTSTAATSTMIITSQATVTTTLSTTTTVLSGTTVLSQVTITAPTPTKTHTMYTVVTSTVATITKHPTITITVHTAPAKSTSVCYAKGGKMWPA